MTCYSCVWLMKPLVGEKIFEIWSESINGLYCDNFQPLATTCFIRPSVRHISFFYVILRSLAFLLLPKCSADLKYDPCPPAHDLGSRIPGLFLSDNVAFTQKQNVFFFLIHALHFMCDYKQTNKIGRCIKFLSKRLNKHLYLLKTSDVLGPVAAQFI